MKQFRDAASFAEGVAWQMRAKRVTFRYFGQNGELRRPMIHRFEVKGGHSIIEAMADNIVMKNPLFEKLRARRAPGGQ